MKISAIVKGSICVLGLVGVGNLFAAPANAGDAAARGAVTIVRPSGSSISVSGEITAPTGTQFPGPLTITPTPGTGVVGGNDEDIASLEINPGTVEASVATAGSGSIESAIAELITTGAFTDVQDLAALVRAASAGSLE
ncbi:hypothetical protein A4S05_30100 [Nostoc sp. KVJ20]|uniref:hypothetical protein n=1 Tax=Nostoc sp. KVJ20 TaxID=457944 RepID=UPI00083DDBC5|nr:hypothetical protein [Nostoc sp. KVJ20]ODH01172.1 hypothetical protein A4S05_30100 [Nostoc sp. KVJ20]